MGGSQDPRIPNIRDPIGSYDPGIGSWGPIKHRIRITDPDFNHISSDLGSSDQDLNINLLGCGSSDPDLYFDENIGSRITLGSQDPAIFIGSRIRSYPGIRPSLVCTWE